MDELQIKITGPSLSDMGSDEQAAFITQLLQTIAEDTAVGDRSGSVQVVGFDGQSTYLWSVVDAKDKS